MLCLSFSLTPRNGDLSLCQRRRRPIRLDRENSRKRRLSIPSLQERADLLGYWLDCGYQLIVRERVVRNEFVGRNTMLFIVLVYVNTAKWGCHGGMVVGCDCVVAVWGEAVRISISASQGGQRNWFRSRIIHNEETPSYIASRKQKK